jgi:hypothetical protein
LCLLVSLCHVVLPGLLCVTRVAKIAKVARKRVCAQPDLWQASSMWWLVRGIARISFR